MYIHIYDLTICVYTCVSSFIVWGMHVHAHRKTLMVGPDKPAIPGHVHVVTDHADSVFVMSCKKVN